MREKIVKFKEIPENLKRSKNIENPENYQKFNVCWQIGFIDFDGEWSWKPALNKIIFHFSDNLITEIGVISNELYDFLTEIDNKTFLSQDDFIEKLLRNIKQQITIQQIRVLLKYLYRDFFMDTIYPKLKEFERLTWYEIITQRNKRERSKHHSIEKEKLSKKAQERLTDLKLDDYDELFSLRLSGGERIWGIRDFNCLQILWWDPNHEVLPYELK